MAFGGLSLTAPAYTTPNFRKQMLDENNPSDLLQQDQLFKQSAQTASGLMTGATPGFDAQANEARDAFKGAQAQSQKAIREQLMNSGMRDTGDYIQQGIVNPQQDAVRQRIQLERQLSVDREAQSQAAKATGLQASTNLLSMSNQNNLEQWKTGRAEELTKQGWTKDEAMQKADIESREKIASNQNQLEQWKTTRAEELTKQGWDKDKAMQQADLDSRQFLQGQSIASQEKLANLDISSREKIAGMQNDTEKWKTDRAEALTRAGWTQESAMQQAGFEQQRTQAELDRQLQKDVESGRLTIEEKKIAQNASQFATEADFKKYALEQGFANDVAGRVWQSSENAMTRTQQAALAQQEMQQQEKILGLQQSFQGTQSALDRQLQKDVEAGRMTMEDKKLAQSAGQFNDELSYKKWATQQGIDGEAANRAWQSSENALVRQHDETMTNLKQKFAEKNINMDAIMSNLESLDPAQAAAVFKNIANQAGIELPTVAPEMDSAGAPIAEPKNTFVSTAGDYRNSVQPNDTIKFDSPDGYAFDNQYHVSIPNGTYVVKEINDPNLGSAAHILYYEDTKTGKKYLAKKFNELFGVPGQAQNASIQSNLGIQSIG